MKRYIKLWASALAILALILLPALGLCETGAEQIGMSGTIEWPVFRGTQWSMNDEFAALFEEHNGAHIERVRESDTMNVKVYEGSVEILGRPAILAYSFDDSQLARATYKFGFASGDAEECEKFVEELYAILTEQYGEPAEAEPLPTNWNADGHTFENGGATLARGMVS